MKKKKSYMRSAYPGTHEEEHSEGGLGGSGRRLGNIFGGSKGKAPGAGSHVQHQQLGRTRLPAPSLIQVVYPSADRAREAAGRVSSISSASGSFPSALHLLCN